MLYHMYVHTFDIVSFFLHVLDLDLSQIKKLIVKNVLFF